MGTLMMPTAKSDFRLSSTAASAPLSIHSVPLTATDRIHRSFPLQDAEEG